MFIHMHYACIIRTRAFQIYSKHDGGDGLSDICHFEKILQLVIWVKVNWPF